jgi:hypothetical protein
MADEDEGMNNDVAQLRKAWVSECVCPELLPFQQELVEGITELLANQEEVLEDIEQTSDQAFSANLYQMEIERIKFSLAKYLRTRLLKIEKFAWKYERDEQFRWVYRLLSISLGTAFAYRMTPTLGCVAVQGKAFGGRTRIRETIHRSERVAASLALVSLSSGA